MDFMNTRNKKRGFGALSDEEQKVIASKGGRSVRGEDAGKSDTYDSQRGRRKSSTDIKSMDEDDSF